MKKLLFIFTLSITTIIGVETSYAGGAIAGGSTLLQQLAQQVTDFSTNASTLSNTASTFVNTGANVKEMILDSILKPLGASLIQIAQQQLTSNITNWAAGGFEGEPLLISNPANYIKKAGLSQVKLALGEIPVDSIFGDSIFNSLVDKYKGSNDPLSQLKELSKSDLPGIIQNSICGDSELTSLALEDIENPDGTYDQGDLTARKNQIYEYACNGDPNTDPEQAARLQSLSEQRPGIGGWDEWLDVTSGNNPYTISKLAEPIVAKKASEQEELATKEIYEGAGPVSQKKCVRYAPSYAIGQTPECEEWQTLNPGEIIQKSIQDAVTAPLERLADITANGISDAAIASFLSSFAMSSITKGINNAITSATGGTPDNSPVVLQKRTTPTNDLLGDPAKKAQYAKVVNSQFVAYQDGLNKLNAVDTRYASAIASYESRITSGKACYTALVTDSILAANDAQITSANSFYQGRINLITPTKTKITAELTKVGLALAYVADTDARISASNSSEEISTITSEYLDTIEVRGYPTITDYSVRQGEYEQDVYQVSQDKEIETYKTTCADIRQTWINNNAVNTNNSPVKTQEAGGVN